VQPQELSGAIRKKKQIQTTHFYYVPYETFNDCSWISVIYTAYWHFIERITCMSLSFYPATRLQDTIRSTDWLIMKLGTCVVHGMPSTKPKVHTAMTARTRYCQWRTRDCQVSIIPVIIVSTPTICTDVHQNQIKYELNNKLLFFSIAYSFQFQLVRGFPNT